MYITNNGLKMGFYTELDELQQENADADFWFLENVKVTHEVHAFCFLHGDCADFAAMLSEVYGYPIECVRYPGDETVEGKLIHAYCVAELHGKKAYIDVRGITTDPVLFYEEFENEVTYFPEDGSIYCTNDEGFDVPVKVERWHNKEELSDGDYEGWTDNEIEDFIRWHQDYYDIAINKDKRIVLEKRTGDVELVHITTSNRVKSICKNGILTSDLL